MNFLGFETKRTNNYCNQDRYSLLNSVNLIYLFQNLFLYSGECLWQTNFLAMMNKEWSTIIVNFTTPETVNFVLVWIYIGYCENAIFL